MKVTSYFILNMIIWLPLVAQEPKDENCLNSLNGRYAGGKVGFLPCYADGFGVSIAENELYIGMWEYGDFKEDGTLELKPSSKHIEEFNGFGEWIYVVNGFFDADGALKFSCPDLTCQHTKVKDILPKINTNAFGSYHIRRSKQTYGELAKRSRLIMEDENDSILMYRTIYISANETQTIKEFGDYALKKYVVKGIWEKGTLVVGAESFFDNLYSKYPKKMGRERPAIQITDHRLRDYHELLKRLNTKSPCTHNDLQYNPYEADNFGHCYEYTMPSRWRTYGL